MAHRSRFRARGWLPRWVNVGVSAVGQTVVNRVTDSLPANWNLGGRRRHPSRGGKGPESYGLTPCASGAFGWGASMLRVDSTYYVGGALPVSEYRIPMGPHTVTPSSGRSESSEKW